ncbi:PH domain-containing protein [Candidatus Roizmanbacteria bacterium]|nr:PH domain-containing protein [Candidatus Roizmanbacteria bacterium]
MENNPKSVNKVFFSYLIHPQIKFETYEPGEKVILLLRAHPVTQLHWIINSIILFIVLFFINFILPSFLLLNQIFVLNVFILVFILSFIWYSFLNWYFNVGIITNKRVIDVDFHGILYKEVTVARLNKIEDITVKSGGYFASLFDYGTVFTQTAGTEANVEFINIPFPSLVVQNINQLLGKKHGSQ